MLWLFIYWFPDVTMRAVVCVQVSAVPGEAGVPGAQLPDHSPQRMQRNAYLRIMGRIKSNTGPELLAKEKSESKKLCQTERSHLG